MNIEDVPRLKEFCQAMLEWIDGGCGDHDLFTAKKGLCNNYARYTYPDKTVVLELVFLGLSRHLYPFGGIDIYSHETKRRTLYQNPERLQWLKDHAK